MNLLVKLSVVPIFFLPLIAGWAGTQEESKVVEQPAVKTTEPWQITVGLVIFYQDFRDDNFLYQLSLHGEQINSRAQLLGEKSDQFSKAKIRFQSFKFCQRSKVKGNRKCRGKRRADTQGNSRISFEDYAKARSIRRPITSASGAC